LGPPLPDTPTCFEINLEQLAQQARELAQSHRLATRQGRDRLLVQLDDNEQLLQAVHDRLMQAVAERRTIPPAGLWLADNFRQVKELMRSVRRDLRRGPRRELPQLCTAAGECMPRVYQLAWELTTRLDAQFDQESLHQFFSAYQTVVPLKLAELWSVGGMLRLGLIEYLCRVAIRAAPPERERELARPAVAHDVRQKAADELSMKHCILSVRELAMLDWKDFVERESAVEHILREDPAGIYQRMSFASRDHYRLIVQRLARRSAFDEEQVARAAIESARNSAATAAAPARAGRRATVEHHVGYYLVDRGRTALEASIGYRPAWREAVGRFVGRTPLASYFGAILIVWLLVTSAVLAVGVRLEMVRIAGPAAALLLLALYGGAAGQFAVSLVSWLCSLLVPPRPMMRLDFSAGIPAEHRTLVAVPALLTAERPVRDLVEQLELRYLANPDDNLWFALLSDFPDADQETLPGDGRLLELARTEIERLNQRYCADRPGVFYLLHRPRKWNRQQGAWMGEERKRGKLAAMNRLLRTGVADAFSATIGDLPRLRSVRYVITLDSDTRLPRDAGRELVGCAAHPLNQAEIDPNSHVVVAGYAVLQPRVTASLPEAHRSRFSRLVAGDVGIDPYTLQTSDLYHDLFGQGSFIGKGIYDVEAFASTCEGRFPENRLLSHDLIEGCFARSGLVNDVELVEGIPTRLLVEMHRRHRWIRGDWQIASWLAGRVPTLRGNAANPLSGLSRWKILDNLRRSLTPALLWSFLLLGWLLAPALAGTCTLLALVLVFGPASFAALPGILRRPEGKPWMLHARDEARRCLRAWLAEAAGLCILPYTVYCHIDAIVRTLYRLGISRSHLLEWTTASEAETRCSGTLRAHYETMGACTVSSVLTAAWLLAVQPRALLVAGPVLLAWLAGPLIAWWLSLPYPCKAVSVTGAEQRQLRRWARHTWHYFDSFAGEADHWLPPDHVQGDPPTTVASRTSPTNMGLALLSGLAAYDLGYLPAAALLDRTSGMLQTMLRLERHRGHFFNWYNTRTLQPAEPRYVSSVDSGNLWGALTVLSAGLEELRNRPLIPPRLFQGLQDTVEVIADLRRQAASSLENDPLDVCIAGLREVCSDGLSGGARQTCERLRRIRQRAADLAARVSVDQPVMKQWTIALVRQSAQAHQHLSRLAFWTQFARPENGLSAELLDAPSAARASRRVDSSPPYDELPHFLSSAGSAVAVQERLRKPLNVVAAEETREKPADLETLYAWLERLDAGCSLGQVLQAAEQIAEGHAWQWEAAEEDGSAEGDSRCGFQTSLGTMRQAAHRAFLTARRELQQIASATGLCQQLSAMDFRFLFHPRRKLLAVGFNVNDRRCDESCYDLLASEARLTSFLAVSHGQLPLEHWFALGRMVTVVRGTPTLLSWSGSMFEYLLPMLIMPSYQATLLDATCRAAVKHQIRYARRRGVPWGISESCSSTLDGSDDYGYRAFGVPGLGLAPNLGKHLVIAPYAAALALVVAPREACANLARLEQLGYLSSHGFYDAIDYTAGLSRPGSPVQPCKIVMAHHSGMTLLALSHALLGPTMPQRFLRNPPCAAHDILLQERVPRNVCPVDPETLHPAPPVVKECRRVSKQLATAST
jgi:hypothetical protein